jgi:hypothetical protein
MLFDHHTPSPHPDIRDRKRSQMPLPLDIGGRL